MPHRLAAWRGAAPPNSRTHSVVKQNPVDRLPRRLRRRLELPMLRTDSSGDVPDIVCPSGMQPMTPRALCKPLGAAPREPADSCCKAAAAPAAAGHPGWATARRPLLALGLQLVLLPLLLSSLHAVLGGPAQAPDASLGSIRTWWIACSCTATLLLLCAHAAYAKLGWRMGMALDGLTLVLRAGAHALACLLQVWLPLPACMPRPARHRAATTTLPLAHRLLCCAVAAAAAVLTPLQPSQPAYPCLPPPPAAAACHSLACLLPSAAILLMCRLLLPGCALACPAGVTKAPKGASVATPDLHVQLWHKA